MNLHQDKSGGAGRAELLRAIDIRKAMTLPNLVQYTGRSRDYLASVLRELESDGLVHYDSNTSFFRLTDLGADVRFKKPKSGISDSNPVNLEAQREQLLLDFHGPHGIAIVTVEDDPVLSERLALYIADEGPVVDLTAIPKHRRPQVIEEAIDFWQSITREGPCGFCGTKVQRSSGASLGWLDQSSSGFTVRPDGTRSCAWCTNFLSDHTADEFRETIGNAVAGTRGIPVMGFYRYATPDLVPFATEVSFAGTAWGYLTKHRTDAILQQALTVVHPKRFCVTAEQARQTSIPGLVAPEWDAQALRALTPRRYFRPLADAVRAAEEELAAAERRKHHEKTKAIQQAHRNAKIEQNSAAEQPSADLRDRAKKLGVL